MIRFGNDGWKARYDDGFTRENAARVAAALGSLGAAEREGATVYVGYDTRRGSVDIAEDVAGVLSLFGLKAKLSDSPVPTPALAWSCAQDENSLGAIMVTASELSCEYGGIIVRGTDGGPCTRDFLEDVERAVPAQAPSDRGPFSQCNVTDAYRERLLTYIDEGLIRARSPKVVVDSMYGTAVGLVADLLRSCGCEVIEIHQKSLGDFGGIHPSPTEPWADECEQTVLLEQADLGIVFDCDADRIGLIDEKGRLLAVRELVPFVLAELSAKGMPQNRVVTTLTSSALIERQAESLGLAYTPVSVGFTYIYDEMGEGDVLLGAEEYGGICVPAHLPERDGILAALLAVEGFCRGTGALSAQIESQGRSVGRSCWTRRDIRIDSASAQALRNVLPGFNPAELAGMKPITVSHADGLRLGFENGSWVLVRQARAEPIVRIYAEAADSSTRDALLDAARDLIASGPVLI